MVGAMRVCHSHWGSIYAVLVLVLMLWPFDFKLPVIGNGVTIGSPGGAEFPVPGIIVSKSPPRLLGQRLRQANGLTIETRLRTFDTYQTGPARIVSYSLDISHRNFTLGQHESDLIWRLRRRSSDPNGLLSEIRVPGVFSSTRPQYLVVTSDLQRHRVYVDGELVHESKLLKGDFQSWDDEYQLLVGNELTGNRAWLGSLENFAVYDQALSAAEVHDLYSEQSINIEPLVRFEFNALGAVTIEDLIGSFPDLSLHAPRFLGTVPAFKLVQRRLRDVAFNAVLFVPLGILLFLTSTHGRMPIKVLVLIAVLGPGVAEGMQSVIESRTSSALDLLCQYVGCVLGAVTCMLTVAPEEDRV